MSKQRRANKAEIAGALAYKAKIERQKTLARLLFPAVEQLPTVFDAQTAFGAAAGFIKQGLIEKEAALKVSDLNLSVEKVEKGPIKDAIAHLLEATRSESAKDALEIIDAMGNKLGQFLAQKHMKDPMTEVPAAEYIAD